MLRERTNSSKLHALHALQQRKPGSVNQQNDMASSRWRNFLGLLLIRSVSAETSRNEHKAGVCTSSSCAAIESRSTQVAKIDRSTDLKPQNK
eukprot:1279623-Pleurochrysis_carterae.AAC.2